MDSPAQFDLAREMAEADGKKPWASGLHARTLLKRNDLRIVLIAMEDGAHMKEHHADGSISVHVLKGQLRMTAEGQTYELGVGNLLSLAASIKHDVVSVGDSAFLLTISWPSTEELAAMKHRDYGS